MQDVDLQCYPVSFNYDTPQKWWDVIGNLEGPISDPIQGFVVKGATQARGDGKHTYR